MTDSYELPRNPTSEFLKTAKPFAQDLEDLFVVMERRALALTKKAGDEGWTVERLESELDDLIGAKPEA